MHTHTYDYTEHGGTVQTWTKTDDLGRIGPEFLVESREFQAKPTVELNIGALLMFNPDLTTDFDEAADGPNPLLIADDTVNIKLSPQEARWLGSELLKAAGS